MRLIAILVFCIFIAGCDLKVDTGTDKKTSSPQEAAKSYKRNTNKIRNRIELKTKGGVTVEQAYLTYGDDGTLVDEENITALNRQIKLNLSINGWKAEGDRVFLEGEEKVTSEDGDVVLSVSDLFASNGIESVSVKDAKELYLNVVVTRINRLSDYFLVEFRVWNKKVPDQEVIGSYKFHLDNM
jgi:hypothetical protein